MKSKPEAGSKVRLTAAFLRNTGQYKGQDAFSKWTVIACDCKLCATGRFIAVNEKSGFDTSEDRHINIGNIEIIK